MHHFQKIRLCRYNGNPVSWFYEQPNFNFHKIYFSTSGVHAFTCSSMHQYTLYIICVQLQTTNLPALRRTFTQLILPLYTAACSGVPKWQSVGLRLAPYSTSNSAHRQLSVTHVKFFPSVWNSPCHVNRKVLHVNIEILLTWNRSSMLLVTAFQLWKVL